MKACAIIVALALPSFAAANSEACLDAKNSGNNERWLFWGNHIVESGRDLTLRQQNQAAKCLKDFPGGPYIYQNGQFIAEDMAEAAAETHDKAETEANAARARLADYQEQMAQQAVERRVRVVEQLQDSCTAMFRQDPDEAITNRMCFDLFMEQGLPD